MSVSGGCKPRANVTFGLAPFQSYDCCSPAFLGIMVHLQVEKRWVYTAWLDCLVEQSSLEFDLFGSFAGWRLGTLHGYR